MKAISVVQKLYWYTFNYWLNIQERVRCKTLAEQVTGKSLNTDVMLLLNFCNNHSNWKATTYVGTQRWPGDLIPWPGIKPGSPELVE